MYVADIITNVCQTHLSAHIDVQEFSLIVLSGFKSYVHIQGYDICFGVSLTM